jgi:hypothetical protein
MDIERKTCDIWTWIKNSQYILHKHWYTYSITLPVRRNPQHRRLSTIASYTSAPPFQPLLHHRNVFHPVTNRFTRQTLPTVNRKYFFVNILCIESFGPQKKRTSDPSSLVVHTWSTIAILTTETSFWMCPWASATSTVMKLDCVAT